MQRVRIYNEREREREREREKGRGARSSDLLLSISAFIHSPVKIYLDRCSKTVRAGYGNVDLPWLYTQPLQNIGDANVCIVLGK
jgi:hypothetical protein